MLQTGRMGAFRWWVLGGVAVLAGLGGCATAPLGKSVLQEVRIETPGCPPVPCTLRNDRGSWAIEQTPASVRVLTSDKPLEVACGNPGQASGTSRPLAEQRPASGSAPAVGAAVGGGITAAAVAPAAALGGPFTVLVVAAVVAGAFGGSAAARAAESSQREFSYPTLVQVALHCTPAAGGDVEVRGAAWGLVVRGVQADDGQPLGAVRIVAVTPGGRAAAAGLQVNDLVLAVNGRPLSGTLALADELGQAHVAVSLIVRRGTELLQITLAP
jgi:hypothetical protein